MRDERLTVSWPPLPRIGIGELHQPPHHQNPALDSPFLIQEAGLLLAHPASQHRRLRIQMDHSVGEFQMRSTRQIGSLSHRHLHCIKRNIVEASPAARHRYAETGREKIRQHSGHCRYQAQCP
jgi:hypothetical protein